MDGPAKEDVSIQERGGISEAIDVPIFLHKYETELMANVILKL
jgi:hypothetical protein